MNAILGTVQTVKAEHSLNSLKALSAPMAKVIRDGAIREIPGREVTIGDEVLLDAGDFVPADGRLVESASLKVDESALTGESLGVEKITDAVEGEVPLGDRKDMVFSGSFVTYGRGRFLVTGIGTGHRSGKDRRASEERVREKDASAGESGSVRKEIVYPDPGILRYSLRCECFPWKQRSGIFPLCGSSCSSCNPGGTELYRDDRAFLWNPENGERGGNREKAAGRGRAGKRFCDLFG